MAVLTLFINRPQKTEIQRVVSNAPAPIVMDAQLSESFKVSSEATEHPIEDGADITDHVVVKPDQLTITGLITETPFTLGTSLAGAASTVGSTVGAALAQKMGGSGLGAVGGVAGSVVGGLAGKTLSGILGLSPTNRLQGVITELKATRDSKDPVTIQTGLQKYDNYILTDFVVERNQRDGRAIRCTLTFKQLIKVSTDTVQIPVPKTTSGVPKQKLGKQGVKDPNSSESKGASLAYQLSKAAGG